MDTKELQEGRAKFENIAPRKLEYRKPVLNTYGLVKELTQSTGSMNGDGGQSMMT